MDRGDERGQVNIRGGDPSIGVRKCSDELPNASERFQTHPNAPERLLVMFPNAISEVISELKSIREPPERISGGPHIQLLKTPIN